MSDIPPPPTPDPYRGVPTPRPAPARRPGVVTGAAGILMVAGALSLVVGAIALSSGGLDIDAPFADGKLGGRVAAVLLVVQGGLALVAGWLVLRLRPAGRILGIVVATLGIVTGLTQLGRTGSPGLLALVLNSFVLYGLLAYGFVFKGGLPPR